jgi:beta-galactosidase
MAWQAVAHGADEVGYWQWRSALNGQEQYHGVLVGPDGTPVPFYQEVQQTAADFSAAEGAFRGTTVVSQVALLFSYDSRWAIDFQKHNQKYDQIAILKSYYHGLRRAAQAIDVVNAYAPLDQYKLVVAPDLNMIPQDLAEHLLAYVKGGGHLVLGPRSGMKDQFNSLLPQRQPGYLAESLGGRVEQYYALDQDVPVGGEWGNGQATLWAEQMNPSSPDTHILMRFGKGNGWLDDQPAVISRSYGKGQIAYIGAVLDDKLTAAAIDWMIKLSGVSPAFGPVPDGVEVSRRSSDQQQAFVLINFSRDNQHIALPRTMKMWLHKGTTDSVDLVPYGVEVLTEAK